MEQLQANKNSLQKRRVMIGTVVSNKMQKTIVVRVDRKIPHKLYKKYVVQSVRYKAHDENNTAKIGDKVSLVESRPLSRHKRWVLQKIIRSNFIPLPNNEETQGDVVQ